MGILYDDFKAEAEKSGYFVNGDVEFVEFLLENLKTNEERYGYASCPCRLSTGIKEAEFMKEERRLNQFQIEDLMSLKKRKQLKKTIKPVLIQRLLEI